MVDSVKKFYETNIIDPTVKVISLSDIHGDIQSFIISLRDCAKVIRKKKPSQNPDSEESMPNLKNYSVFNNETYDNNMEDILNLDLNTSEKDYIDDLNYEWCGGNTHVVICGDMIDPFRDERIHTHCIKTGNIACSYYPQIELKILMFINAINNQAKHRCGKIVKLFGNHELGNIILGVNYGYNVRYTYKDDQNIGYYKGVSRLDIFRVGNHGFNLLVEGGCGILIKINDTIFVHGDLVESYDIYDDLNQFINDPDPAKRTEIKWYLKFYPDHLDDYSSLFSKRRSDDALIHERISAKNAGNRTDSDKFCSKLVDSFRKFVGDRTDITEHPDQLKLVIGHCPQHYSSTISSEQNETYSQKMDRSDNVMEVFGNKIYSGPAVFDITRGVNNDFTNNRTKIFGITMECLIPDTNLNRVYRVDIGSSRGFDYYKSDSGTGWNPIPEFPVNLEKENKFLYSKTPQVLEINIDGSIRIIKSKMRNTRIHLPRPAYELHAKTIPELDIHTNPVQDHYRQKYLKYKNKYLQLKQN
jgi:hypothetical protein